MFGGEVTIGFGVAREALIVVAEDIIGEEELGVATAAGAQ